MDIFYIENTVSEFRSEISGYFASLDEAEKALQYCQDWYSDMGTGKIYKVGTGLGNQVPELVYANPDRFGTNNKQKRDK